MLCPGLGEITQVPSTKFGSRLKFIVYLFMKEEKKEEQAKQAERTGYYDPPKMELGEITVSS